MTPIYLDYNASTPPAPEAVAAMRPWLGEAHANPHAEHLGGRRAAAAVDKALASIGALIGADAQDLVLTSGATEANNLALLGILATNDPGTAQLLHSSVEHKSVIEVAKHLKSGGVCVASLSVNQEGRVDVESLTTSVSNKTFNRSVVSVMHANNEVGTVQPIGEISRRLQPFGNLLHVDAAQTAGKIPIDVNVLGADLLTISSHKLYGPAGIGALYISPRARALIRPIMFGGGQQGGLRSGTVPVFLAVGFGSACALATERIADDATHSEMVANAFLTQLAKDGIPFDVLGDAHARLPGLRSVRLPGINAADVLTLASTAVAASTGSACNAGEIRASHVLRAIGLGEEASLEVIRFGFGRQTTEAEAVTAASAISAAALRTGARS